VRMGSLLFIQMGRFRSTVMDDQCLPIRCRGLSIP
jgi:hypothetical protein